MMNSPHSGIVLAVVMALYMYKFFLHDYVYYTLVVSVFKFIGTPGYYLALFLIWLRKCFMS